MFPLTAFGLFIILRSNISGLPIEMRISLIWLIHLKLLPCFDSFSIILYMSLESLVFSLFSRDIQKPIIRDFI